MEATKACIGEENHVIIDRESYVENTCRFFFSISISITHISSNRS